MKINKDSRIVEVFSNQMLGKVDDKNELRDAHDYIKELASNATPDNRYEIAQIMSFLIENDLDSRVDYLDMIADVKQTGFGEKAQFKIEVDGVEAYWQAKSSTTRRSRLTNDYLVLDTDEVSVRPVVDFYELVSGKTDLVRLSEIAARRMEIKIAQRIQNVVYQAFKEIGTTPNYAVGSGITKATFDSILYAMRRAGGNASIVGDIEALAKFTELSGFDGRVADNLAVEHNENGHIGNYNGSPLIQLNNPFKPNSFETEMRKDLIYVLPNVEENLMPVKVQFEGDVQFLEGTNIDSKASEFRFDQYVGVGVAGVKKLLGVYEDSQLSE